MTKRAYFGSGSVKLHKQSTNKDWRNNKPYSQFPDAFGSVVSVYLMPYPQGPMRISISCVSALGNEVQPLLTCEGAEKLVSALNEFIKDCHK